MREKSPERSAIGRSGRQARRSGNPVAELVSRGVVVPHPDSVEVGAEVDPAGIAPGVTIHPCCRIRGAGTSVGPGCEIGAEAPATLDDCRLGHGVSLKGGYFAGSVFLDNSSMGSAGHVRPGTIMEEFACAGHAVGFKQTILFPFVTGGSLINFCDVLMAGGTSALRHGEIGSSYVHFNFTPRGDKATASLLGDVPRGVMLDCDPIFLGGQGGLVGPARVEFGSLIPAGCVTRRDILEPGRLVAEEQILRGPVPFNPEIYTAVSRIVGNCVNYIGQLHALKAWYLHVRSRFMNGDAWRRACCEGGVSALDLVLKERIERMHELAAKVRVSAAALKAGHASAGAGELEVQERFVTRWPSLKRRLAAGFGAGDRSALDTFLSSIPSAGGTGFVAAVQSWSRDTRAAGRFWLDGIVKQANSLWAPEMQSFQPPR